MAKLFLSYSRKDEARARRFTLWLEREGHDVWRDQDDIGGGASFSAEIEKALKDCDAVLVLWSKHSVRSAWVRDEAGFGRDAGKLIPFSLDRTEPPLGFRQFQAIDLSKGTGRGEPPAAESIRRAIERVSHVPPAAPMAKPAASRRAPKEVLQSRKFVGVVIAVAAGLAAVAGFIAWQPWSGDRQIAITVVPSPGSSNGVMAADYANVAAADMAVFLPIRFDRATVIAPAEASTRRSGYRMQISADPHGAGADASLSLSDEDGRTTLWSKDWSVADASAVDLKAEVSAAASKAALCLTDARGGSRPLSQPALGLYLTGCADIADSERSNVDFETIFERLTRLAPDFAPGWGYLALTRSWIAEGLEDSSPAAYAAAVQRARETIARARKLNPNSAVTYDAEYHLISNDPFRALQVLGKGAEIEPDDGLIQMHLADELLSVGRMSDSLDAARRAVALEPSSAYARAQYILALVYAGEFVKAKADIADARKRWPKDPEIDRAEYGFEYRYGDARAALQLMPRTTDFSDADMAPNRLVIAARLDPSTAKIDEAIAVFRESEKRDPEDSNKLLLVLGSFDRVEEAYQLLEDPKYQPFIHADALFRPDFAGVRADPRFMQVAARLGLVRYWRNSGYWPDFCKRDRLPYDCKTEAAKYLR